MPDTISANTNTTASMGTNTTFNGTLETPGDRDWVRVSLTEDQTIQVNLDGYGFDALEDPYLRIYDDNGDELASSDDFFGIDSQLTFQAPSAGNYFIEAWSFDGLDDGVYRITTQEVTPPPPSNPLDSLGWGGQIDAETVNVYFATSGQTFDGYTSEGFNAYERGQILEMMDNLSDVIDLDFNVVTNAGQADLKLVLDLNEISSESDPYLGYFNPPGESNAGVGVFNGDLWDRTAGGDLERGGFGYVTIVHELLHGLGMAHPHDDGGTSSIMDGVNADFDDFGGFDLNQGIFTVMTYNSGYFTGTDGSAPADPMSGDYGFEGGAMALDIAYLQQLYGANDSHASGNNVYALARENEDGTYWESIWDTGGTDEIRHNGSDDATIDLREATLLSENGGGGYVSAVDGVAGGYTIANGAVIENATGGSGDDKITGNAAANVLVGGGGNDEIAGNNGADVIRGKGGNDDLSGGGGRDNIRGGTGRDDINGGRSADVLVGGTGADTMNGGSGSDTVRGGRGDDIVNGGGGRDTLLGGTKNDVLNGGGGRDILTGGGGTDTFVFSSISHSRNNNIDTITDFNRGSDNIDVSALDAHSFRSGNQSFDFVGMSEFSAAGQIRIERDGDNIIVQADVNGDGRADFEIIVEDLNTLSSSDFIL